MATNYDVMLIFFSSIIITTSISGTAASRCWWSLPTSSSSSPWSTSSMLRLAANGLTTFSNVNDPGDFESQVLAQWAAQLPGSAETSAGVTHWPSRFGEGAKNSLRLQILCQGWNGIHCGRWTLVLPLPQHGRFLFLSHSWHSDLYHGKECHHRYHHNHLNICELGSPGALWLLHQPLNLPSILSPGKIFNAVNSNPFKDKLYFVYNIHHQGNLECGKSWCRRNTILSRISSLSVSNFPSLAPCDPEAPCDSHPRQWPVGLRQWDQHFGQQVPIVSFHVLNLPLQCLLLGQ